ncbi:MULTISPECIES: cytochrome P450 [Saccharopolyspora]|uniref:cytochrome P450 n=1 Tax=Saccharopolyspora TaxID=1835 RepID=UPI001CD55E77|nr:MULTISPECIES: cytochrome P450 [Saccharopolyspora]MCA1186675.1 cytochrome P450 [Saccharopolyspora sp. 6T]MCA1192535.1 cytochrome P450 [Saccharopolyspora sp. 6V]MCA1225330.1 cytochrome P450 [Saccharopolyspora sp. 6M]MCA1278878.1 cytochrome P450 [Saccharopolyspora sp. 7B]
MTAAEKAPDILSPDFARDPNPSYQVLRDDFPLLWHEPTQSYIISRYADVKRAFREPVFTTQNYDWQLEPVHGRTILQLDGREHAVRRALVAPAFRGSELQEKFLPVIQRNSRALIDEFRGTGRVDLVADYATKFPINVIADMLGLAEQDRGRFQGWYTSIIAFLGNLSQDPDVIESGMRTREEFAEYMIPVIQERRENLGDDLLSTLCTAEIDGTKMSDEDIKAFCSLLLAAGGETTDKAIAAMFLNLLRHPEQLAAVRENRELVPQAFAETLRYSPPVHMIMRQPAEDVELSGGVVPKGSTLTCLIGAANRDEEHYANPERFDVFREDLPARTAFTAAADHLSFALGRHFCVGALLAKSEIEIGINDLLDAMPDARLAPGFDPPEQGVFTRGPESVPVVFTPA